MSFGSEGYWGKPRDFNKENENLRKGQSWLGKISHDFGKWLNGTKKEEIFDERLKEVIKQKYKSKKSKVVKNNNHIKSVKPKKHSKKK